jgi:hypothetical protein
MSLYQKFIFIREEIMKHKWIESERQNHDVGFESALIDWLKNHKNDWIEAQKKIDNRAE